MIKEPTLTCYKCKRQVDKIVRERSVERIVDMYKVFCHGEVEYYEVDDLFWAQNDPRDIKIDYVFKPKRTLDNLKPLPKYIQDATLDYIL